MIGYIVAVILLDIALHAEVLVFVSHLNVMASNSIPVDRKRRGPYLQYLQTRNPLTAMPRRTRLRYHQRISQRTTQQLRKFRLP